ncbi:MAG TPA: SMP-30/gluconolactonase/LRE family protein [Caulobacteraceae bacterium]|jgi:sugar lactone lactonase YvrE
MSPVVECVLDARCLLGEGPVWDDRRRRLWFVDIKAPAIHCFDPGDGALDTWPMPERVGAVALREKSDTLLVSLKSGFAVFDPATGAIERLLDPEPHMPTNRLNDGKCDARGRFWAGTMDDEEQRPTGHLYRLDPDLTLTRFDAGFVVTNGPEWSLDGRTMYFADSGKGAIHAYGFDMETGRAQNPRLFRQLAEGEGHPDGFTLDAGGGLWNAAWGAGRLTRYLEDGTAERTLDVPAPQVTSACFGGDALDVLYVTSARVGLGEAELAAAPLSGALFAVRGLGLTGLPVRRFAG